MVQKVIFIFYFIELLVASCTTTLCQPSLYKETTNWWAVCRPTTLSRWSFSTNVFNGSTTIWCRSENYKCHYFLDDKL